MHRRSRLARPALARFGRATFLAISVIAVTIAGAGLTLSSAVAFSPVLHRAAVIVETGTETRRVVIEFTEDSITGIEALRRAGAEPVVYSFSGVGGAVCRLFGVGRDSGADCLGGTGGDSRYWAYFRAASGASSFQYSRVGAGSTTVRNGDVEGWRFGTGAAPAYVSVATLRGDEPIATTSTTSTLAPPSKSTTGAQEPQTGAPPPSGNPAATTGVGSAPIDSDGLINGGPTGASGSSTELDAGNRASSGVPAAAILKAPPGDSGRGPGSLLLLVLGLVGLGGSAIWARKARARAASR